GDARGERRGAARVGLPAAAGARARQRVRSGPGRSRRFFGRRDGRHEAAAMTGQPDKTAAASGLIAAVRAAAPQEQFLEVVSPQVARERFAQHLDLRPLGVETVALDDALGRVLAGDLVAPIAVPPFDRSGVDGFALRAADTAGANDRAPKQLLLNAEVIACGHAPRLAVDTGTATTIATGGAIPRGADAVVMVEQTELVETPQGPA